MNTSHQGSVTQFPLQFISGLTAGTQQSSQSLIGNILPCRPFGTTKLRVAYNLAAKNMVLIDTAGTFKHSSGVETIGYIFNSASASWQHPVPSFTQPPSPTGGDGAKAILQTADGAEVVFVKQTGVYYESAFAVGCRLLEFDTSTSCWILYNNVTQIRQVWHDRSGLNSSCLNCCFSTFHPHTTAMIGV